MKIINILNSKKSSGHDGLSLNLLKDIKLELAKPIRIIKSNIINQSLNTVIFPDKLKIAKMIMNKLKYVFSQSALILLYYSLILPHINFLY